MGHPILYQKKRGRRDVFAQCVGLLALAESRRQSFKRRLAPLQRRITSTMRRRKQRTMHVGLFGVAAVLTQICLPDMIRT